MIIIIVIAAPEIVTGFTYSQMCDVWSAGIIMYVLLYGRFPFYAVLQETVRELICHHEPDYEYIKTSSEAIDLLKKMLEKNTAHRITASEVLQHPWLTGRKMSDKNQATPENVLDMMRLWRSEMRVNFMFTIFLLLTCTYLDFII